MKKRGQVWIETVLYTLIGLTLMGLALGFVMPKINEARDRAFIEQAINSLSELDGRISNVIQTGPGNVRQTELLMKKGEFHINASSNEILMILRGITKPYSEPDVEINLSRIKLKTETGQKTHTVYLKVAYSVNITYRDEERNREFAAAPTPYKFIIENKRPVFIILFFSLLKSFITFEYSLLRLSSNSFFCSFFIFSVFLIYVDFSFTVL